MDSPRGEMEGLLRACAQGREKCSEEEALARREGRESLERQARLIREFASVLESCQPALEQSSLSRVHRHLRLIRDQMEEAIQAGMEGEDGAADGEKAPSPCREGPAAVLTGAGWAGGRALPAARLEWSLFSEREVPAGGQWLSPASEVGAHLQKHRGRLERIRATAGAVRRRSLEALAGLAVLATQLSRALEQYAALLEGASLRDEQSLLRQALTGMLAAFNNAGLEVIVPLGMPYEDVTSLVEVESWIHHERFVSEVVAQVLEPIVKHAGEIVRVGRVVMGAPLEQAPKLPVDDRGIPGNST